MPSHAIFLGIENSRSVPGVFNQKCHGNQWFLINLPTCFVGVKCLAMLGCHDLDGRYDPLLKKETFDFVVHVNKEKSMTYEIKEDGAQQFYELEGKLKIKLNTNSIAF